MKIIQFIDRVLRGTRIASLTSPTYIGNHMPHDDSPSSNADSYVGERRPVLRDREHVHLVNA